MKEVVERKLEEAVAKLIGFRLSCCRSVDHIGKFNRIAANLGFDSIERCVDHLAGGYVGRKEAEAVARELTIGETYFFRDPPTFNALEKSLFPALIEKGRKRGKKIRLWSAGCSSGEEPYSLAILLDRLIPDSSFWDIRIIASDVNGDFLQKGVRGVYRQWSFRMTPKAIKRRYFRESGNGEWKLDERIRRYVDFRYCNLVMDDFSFSEEEEGFDAIFCNNVLIYFAKKNIDLVVDKLTGSLKTGGWLSVTPVEAPYVMHDHLSVIKFDRISFFQKSQTRRQERRVTNSLKSRAAFSFEEQFSRAKAGSKGVLRDLRHLYEKRDFGSVIDKFEREVKEVGRDGLGLEEREDEIALYLKTLANVGRCREAEKYCRHILGRYKTSYKIYFIYGIIQQELNNAKEAILAFEKSIFLKPDLAIAHFYLGTLYILEGAAKKAERYFQNAHRLVESLSHDSIIQGSDDLTKEELCCTMRYLLRR